MHASVGRNLGILGFWAIGALVLLSACTPSDAFVVTVDLKTDLVVGTEFSTIETRLTSGPTSAEEDSRLVSVTSFASADFISGHRVAEYVDAARGSAIVQVRLIDARGETVQSRDTLLELDRNIAVTVVMTSSCTGVLCPGEGEPMGHIACSAGPASTPAARWKTRPTAVRPSARRPTIALRRGAEPGRAATGPAC